MKLGKQPAKADLRTLKLARFLSETAPVGPDTMDWFSGITDFGMMANDKRGNCTCAGIGHALQTQSAATGSNYIVPDAVVMDAYARWCGFDPSQDQEDGFNPTDLGGVELEVLKQFRRDGMGGKQLLAFASINLDDPKTLLARIKQAIFLFGGIYVGIQLPITAQDQETWDLVLNSKDNERGSWGGHAVWIPGYDARHQDHETLVGISWGKRKGMTLDFVRTYFDEIWALLLGDWAVFGSKDFKLGDLQAELAAVTA